ncbi:MAG: response regulator [SAR324 cluster bacterium]|nr:response regulator [SAR324 cluster bacterium]
MLKHSQVRLKDSIATKLLSYVFSIYLVVSIIVTLFHMVSEYRRVESNVIEDIKIFYLNSNPTMATALWEADKDQMQSVLDGIIRSPTILGVRISDISGRYVHTLGKTFKPESQLQSLEQGKRGMLVRKSGGDLFGYQFPLIYSTNTGDHHLGKMILYSSPAVIFARVQSSYLFIIINAIIKTIVLWVVFLWFSRFLLQRPLSVLTSVSQEIALDNLEKVRIDAKTFGKTNRRPNELQILGESFNAMVQKLLESRNELAQSEETQKRNLEQQVVKRTKELSDSEERYRRLVELAPFGIAIHQNGKLVFINKAGVAIVGAASTEQLEGKSVFDIVHPDYRQRVSQRIQGLIQNNFQAAPLFEEKFIQLDGNVIDVEVAGIPFIYDNKPAIQVVFQEITERKKWEAKLQRERESAQKANQAKSLFLSNMSHELRTPLNAILGFSQMMAHGQNLTPDQTQNLNIINRSGEHLLTLINDILDMSKIEAGQINLKENDVDLFVLLEDIKNLFKIRMEDKGLSLQMEHSDNIPQFIRTDEAKLRQILMNLISNAVKFTEEGSITIRVAVEKNLPLELRFEVQDTGSGIAPEDIECLFEPFTQTKSSQKSQEGTGLGLSISRKFVQLLGGDITVKSQLGEGSTFQFTILARQGNQGALKKAPSPQVVGVEAKEKHRILIVDDVETNRQVLVKWLTPLEFELKEAANGQEAVAIWKEWNPHLVWMDIRMPVMDGYEATRQIKATVAGKDIVIIAVSASAFEDKREETLAAGCDDFIAKPFKENEIFEMMQKHLGLQYIYEENHQQKLAETKKNGENINIQEEMRKLPRQWKTEMKQAIEHLNPKQIHVLMGQLREQNEILVDAIWQRMDRFEYETILVSLD